MMERREKIANFRLVKKYMDNDKYIQDTTYTDMNVIMINIICFEY